MVTWEKGRELLAEEFKKRSLSFEEFQKIIKEKEYVKVKGEAVFMTGRADVVPFSLIQNMENNKIIHSETAILHISFDNVPRVPNMNKIEVNKLGGGFFMIIAHYGFMETPDIEKILTLAIDQGLEFNIENIRYFLGREKLILVNNKKMAMWRKKLYKFMSTVSTDFSSFSGIPTSRVIEIGIELQL